MVQVASSRPEEHQPIRFLMVRFAAAPFDAIRLPVGKAPCPSRWPAALRRECAGQLIGPHWMRPPIGINCKPGHRRRESALLVNRIQHRGGRPLGDLVFEGGNRDSTLSAVWFWYVQSTARLCPIRSSVDPIVQFFDVAIEVCLVVLPPQARLIPLTQVFLDVVCRVIRLGWSRGRIPTARARSLAEFQKSFPDDRAFSLLKRWALGTYHGLRRQRVDTYLNEFVFRYNRRLYRHV
jgi:hypothetical protein